MPEVNFEIGKSGSSSEESLSEPEVQYDEEIVLKAGYDLKNDETIKPDYRSVKYKSTTEHLNCPICQQPFIEPVTTICGHTFCKECIFECFKMSRNSTDSQTGSCPLDRTPLDSCNVNDIFPTPLIVTNLIDDLKVYCLNQDRGCEWSGCRWELEHHLGADCGHTGVKCNGQRKQGPCSLMVERRFKEQTSVEDCVHRLYTCDFCSHQITQVTKEDHLNEECPFNYQTCELCSNDMIPKKYLLKHEENCSKIGTLKCPANKIGCSWIGNSETALEIHLQQNNCQLNSVLPHFEALTEKLDSLSDENTFLQKQINKILDSVIQGKVTNLGYSEPIEEINKLGSGADNKNIYMTYELDRLKYEIEEKILPFIERENSSVNERQNVMNGLVNDNFMMKDDLSLQRVLINSLRKQLQFLLFKNRSGSLVSNFGGLNMGTSDFEADIFDLPKSSSEERLNLKL